MKAETKRIGLVRRIGVMSLMMLAAMPAGDAQRRIPPPIPTGTSAIRGRVIDSVTKAPVAGCTLRVGTLGYFTELVSDLDGAYELKDVAAGNYFFFLQCPAHQLTCPGSDSPNCRLVEVVRDQEREGVDFQVVPGAIARGQVMTFDGRPVTRASVRLGRGIRGEPTPPCHTVDDGYGRTLRAD